MTSHQGGKEEGGRLLSGDDVDEGVEGDLDHRFGATSDVVGVGIVRGRVRTIRGENVVVGVEDGTGLDGVGGVDAALHEDQRRFHVLTQNVAVGPQCVVVSERSLVKVSDHIRHNDCQIRRLAEVRALRREDEGGETNPID